MDEISKLKQELKKVNAEAANIRNLPAEKRADFGKEINRKRQEILAKITDIEKVALDADVLPIDVTAWSGVNEAMPIRPDPAGSAADSGDRIHMGDEPAQRAGGPAGGTVRRTGAGGGLGTGGGTAPPGQRGMGSLLCLLRHPFGP